MHPMGSEFRRKLGVTCIAAIICLHVCLSVTICTPWNLSSEILEGNYVWLVYPRQLVTLHLQLVQGDPAIVHTAPLSLETPELSRQVFWMS